MIGKKRNNSYEMNNKIAKKGRWKRMKRWQKSLILIFIAALIVAGALIGYTYTKLDKIEKVKVNEEELSAVDVDGYLNILILGVDARDMNKLEGSRTDTILIASINEKTKDVKLISLYRDTFLKMGDTSTYDKITHAHAFGGAKMAIKSINQALDLNIKKFAIINFEGVSDMVDALGGITLNIEDYEIDELNRAVEENARILGQTYKPVEKAGKQTVNGQQALAYARIRQGVGDDFKRTERARITIKAILDKAKKSNPSKLNKMVDKVLPFVRTNLSNSDILLLASRVTKYSIKGSIGFPYSVAGGMHNGVSYVFPTDLLENVKRLHKEAFGQEDYVPSAMVSQIAANIMSIYNNAGATSEYEDIPQETQPSEETSTTTETKPEPTPEPSAPVQPVQPEPTPQPTPSPDPGAGTEQPDPAPQPPVDGGNQ